MCVDQVINCEDIWINSARSRTTIPDKSISKRTHHMVVVLGNSSLANISISKDTSCPHPVWVIYS